MILLISKFSVFIYFFFFVLFKNGDVDIDAENGYRMGLYKYNGRYNHTDGWYLLTEKLTGSRMELVQIPRNRSK